MFYLMCYVLFNRINTFVTEVNSMQYIPIKLSKKIVELNKTCEWKECLNYAIKHNCDVIYDDIKNTDAVKVMYNFQKQGFRIDLSEIEVLKTDGTIEKIINCMFVKK